MRKLLLLGLLLCFSLSFGVRRLDCYLTTSCSGFVVYKLSNYTNAHGALYNYTSENYTWVYCCEWPYLNRSCDESILFHLSNYTNAHAELNNESYYDWYVCLSAYDPESDIYCEYDSSCPEGFDCLGSLSTEIGNDTNLHLGNCSEYATKICCRLSKLMAVLEQESLEAEDNYVYNSPRVILDVVNTGNRTAVIKEVRVGSDRNYYFIHVPSYIPSGSIGRFEIGFQSEKCADYGSQRDFNISILYQKTEEEDGWYNVSGSYTVGKPFRVDMSEEMRSLYVGDVDYVPIDVVNLGSESITYNVSITVTSLFAQLLRYSEIYSLSDLEGQEFTADYLDRLHLKLVPPSPLEEEVKVRITNVDCPSLYEEKKFFVKTLTKTTGLFTVSVTPDLGWPQILLLLLISSIFLKGAKVF